MRLTLLYFFFESFPVECVRADVLQFGNVCETHIYDKRDNLSLSPWPGYSLGLFV